MVGSNKKHYSMTKKLVLLAVFIFPFLLQGCLDASESDYERQVREADETIETYLTNNNIDAQKQSSGVHIEILHENEDGKQVVEDHVVGILYKMIHLEGEYEIEVHSDTLNPLRFSYSFDAGYNALHPAGLNYEIGNMRLGEKFRFYVPSYQAFGDYAHDDLFDIYSHFIVEVELIELKTEEEIFNEELESIQHYIESNDIEAESYPNGLYYVPVEEGDGEQPAVNSQVEIHFTRKYLDGTVIETTEDDEPLQVFLNNNQLVAGLENGIPLMREGGKAEFIMPSELAFGKSVQVIPQQLREEWAEEGEINPLTKPYSPVIYEIELIEVN